MIYFGNITDIGLLAESLEKFSVVSDLRFCSVSWPSEKHGVHEPWH